MMFYQKVTASSVLALVQLIWCCCRPTPGEISGTTPRIHSELRGRIAAALHERPRRAHCIPRTRHHICRPNKAFDTVSRERLWKMMAKFGCHHQYITTFCQFPRRCDGPCSRQYWYMPWFFSELRLKQGCVLDPTPSSTTFLRCWLMHSEAWPLSEHQLPDTQETLQHTVLEYCN